MKKRLPAPSSEYEHVENFLEEIIIPQQQVEVNTLFYIFNTIETIVKLQPQYSDVFRGVLNKKKQLLTLEKNEHVQINGEYDSLVEKIIDQLEEIEELIDKDFEKNFDKYDDVICDLWFLFQKQTSAIITNHLVLSELMFSYYERYLD